jgi:hypothetical protein
MGRPIGSPNRAKPFADVRYLSRLSPVISAIIHANEQLSCSEMTGFRA